MSKVVIEGTILPSAHLATGERKTVERTEFIDKLIRRGYVTVVDERTGTEREADEQAAAARSLLETEREADEQAAAAREEIAAGTPTEDSTKAQIQAHLDERRISYPVSATKADLLDLLEDSDG